MALTIFSLLALIVACNGAAMYGELDPRIVNGEDVKLGDRSYQMSLQQKDSSFHFCGGSALDNTTVITAAHCVVGRSASSIKVVGGTVDLLKPGIVRNVKRIIVHKQYNSYDSWINDIALLKLDSPIVPSARLSFVPLPSANDLIKPNDIAVVSGWGRIREGGPTTTRLQKASLYVANQDYCKYMYQSEGYKIYNSHICAFDPSVMKGSCHGDSGGPLTVKNKLVGIVSWAKGCASTSYPTVYTRVASHLKWIKENAA